TARSPPSAISSPPPRSSGELPHGPHDVGGERAPQERRAVAENRDERGQVLELEPVVERVAEAMGPVEEGQRHEREEVEARDGVREQMTGGLIARSGEPTEGEGERRQQDVDREEQGRDRPPRAEDEPEKGRQPLEHVKLGGRRRPRRPRGRPRPGSSKRPPPNPAPSCPARASPSLWG